MRKLTAEQEAAKKARREKFSALWKQVAAMPELERVQLANKLGIVTCEGHELSLGNTMLIALQNPTASVVGGFRQWIKHGRAVMKGQHGMMIWVPTAGKSEKEAPPMSVVVYGQEAPATDHRFIIGTVFDISQTQEIETSTPSAAASEQEAQAEVKTVELEIVND